MRNATRWCWSVVAMLGVAAVAQTPSTGPALKRPGAAGTSAVSAANEPLHRAMKQLQAEAAELPLVETGVTQPPKWTRPHPGLSTLGPDAANDALRLMQQKLTDTPVQDVYVRWHLMHVYRQARAGERRQNGPALVDILRRTVEPPPLGIERRPEYIYTPEHLWRRYIALLQWPGPGAPSFTVGYPPFHRVISGGAALAQMSPEAVARYRAAVDAANKQHEINKKEAAKIFPLLTRVDFPENVLFNRRLHDANVRIRDMTYMARSLRGELIYEMIKTGDPRMLEAVGVEISNELEAGSIRGFDLMAFVYLAGFDGVLDENYTRRDLSNFARGLEAIARRFEGVRNYSGHSRNFGDYAFTLIVTLRDGDSLVSNQVVLTHRVPTPGE